MRKILLLTCLVASSTIANAVLVERYSGRPLNSLRNSGSVQTTTIYAVGRSAHVVAVGQGNIAGNSIGVVKGGAMVRGQVNINALAINTSALAIGSGNIATNDIGTVGGW
jgi:hypothetical protein